jgi:hypothetical protein
MSMVPPLTQLEPDQFCLIVLVGKKLPPKTPRNVISPNLKIWKIFPPNFPNFSFLNMKPIYVIISPSNSFCNYN